MSTCAKTHFLVLTGIPELLYCLHRVNEFQINVSLRDRNESAGAQQGSSEGLRIQALTVLLRHKLESLLSSCSGPASIERFTVHRA